MKHLLVDSFTFDCSYKEPSLSVSGMSYEYKGNTDVHEIENILWLFTESKYNTMKIYLFLSHNKIFV